MHVQRGQTSDSIQELDTIPANRFHHDGIHQGGSYYHPW
jgi:hypothetical protein